MFSQPVTRRALLKLACLALAGAALGPYRPRVAASGPSPSARAVVDLVAMYPGGELSDAQLDSFHQKYPAYAARRIDVDLAKVPTMIAAGEPLDMYRILGTHTPSYVRQRLCRDLTDLFQASSTINPSEPMGTLRASSVRTS